MVPINATLLSRTFHLAVTGAAPSREAQLLLLSMRRHAFVSSLRAGGIYTDERTAAGGF